MIRIVFALAVIAVLAACAPTGEPSTSAKTEPVYSTLDSVLAGNWRDPGNVARDIWRHPLQTLTFFGITSNQTVIEVTPGGGWYAEILAPFLRKNGKYIAVLMDPNSATSSGTKSYYMKQIVTLKHKFADAPEVYGSPETRYFDVAKPVFGKSGSADMVLTFRNVHNWQSLDTVDVMFQGFFDVLKPGGTLGLVEHRANSDVDISKGNASGYVDQNQVIAFARAAGFVLEESSEINANPADTKNHEAGVSSLPPAMSLGYKDRDKYKAIGESDRMTLRFHKPEAVADANH